MDQVSQIREKVDIVSFISEFIALKKAGRNFKANCPFHQESTPSFVVSPDRQIWHCFGCGKGGDAYTFLMEYERIEFPEALRLLAQRTGVELTSYQQDSGVTSKKERLYKINAIARDFYHYILTKHNAGKRGLEYIQNREVTPKVIETFKLGFSPGTGTALVSYLIDKKKYSKEDLLEAGLAFQAGNRVVDFFRGRLMFPLVDHRDNVVGFAGRVLDGNVPSKYINTRETFVYHKGEMFYGLNITKDAIRRENQAIIVEGEFDVISCFQNGVGNVVGVKGTALTESQVTLLARYAQKITFCFDGDKAGQEAIKRSLVIVEKKGLTPTVIEIPGGKDPDESLRKDPGLFKKAVKEDIGIYDYLLMKTLAAVDTGTPEGKKYVADTLLPFIAVIKNEIIKEHYLKKISKELDTTYESIAKELQRLTTRDTVKPAKPAPKVKRPKEEAMEEYLLSLILQSERPKQVFQKAIQILSESMSKERAYHKIMDHLLQHFDRTDGFNSKAFGDGLPKELLENYEKSLLFPLPAFENEDKLLTEVEKTAQKLRTMYIQQHLKKLAEEIKQKEESGDEAVVNELKKSYSHLASRLE